jgi:hypothetical protein
MTTVIEDIHEAGGCAKGCGSFKPRVQVPMFIKSMICGFSYSFLLLKFKSGIDIFKLRS